jgi:hypothetical protein
MGDRSRWLASYRWGLCAPNDQTFFLDEAEVDLEDGVQRVGDRSELSHREVGATRLDVGDVEGRGLQSLRDWAWVRLASWRASRIAWPTSLAVGVGACRTRHPEPVAVSRVPVGG